MCSEYNGWPNYETWNANLWIDNEEGVYLTAWNSASKPSSTAKTRACHSFKQSIASGKSLSNCSSMYGLAMKRLAQRVTLYSHT